MKAGRPKTKLRRHYPKGHRPPESYKGKTPEARLKQLSPLVYGRGGNSTKSTAWTLARLQKTNIITFAEQVLHISFDERPAQKVLLKAMYGLPLKGVRELLLYRDIAGGLPRKGSQKEKDMAVWAVGARGGKSMLSSIVCLYESICRYKHWNKFLQKGEAGYAVIIATRQRQAEQIIQANCSRMLENSAASWLIEEVCKGELRLKTGMRITSFPCNSTSARGLPIHTLCFDELAHYRFEGVKADETIYSSLRPRQSQFPKAKCLMISTPSAKQGLFYEIFSAGFHVPGRLTVQASTQTMNPVIPEKFIRSEERRDVDNFRREFLAEFAEAVDSFFSGCETELAQAFQLAGDQRYQSKYTYVAAIDQSGLSGRDKFALAIVHAEGSRAVVDVVRSWATKDADEILKNIGKLCLQYHINQIWKDKYASGWVEQALLKLSGINEVITRPALPQVFVNLKSLILAGNCLLPDNRELRLGLERTQAYYSRSNTLSICHERNSIGGHADVADAAATAVFAVSQVKQFVKPMILGNLFPRGRRRGVKQLTLQVPK